MNRPLGWLAVVAAFFAFSVSTFTIADPDLWGHVRFGLDLLRTHRLPNVDPYSFTQDVAWINHEWLSELQMGAAYALFGARGLSLLKGVLATAALLIVWNALARVRFDARLVTTAMAMLGSIALARTLRPQLWSLVCLAILCRALADRRRWRPWLPLLFACWANLHGGWIVGLAVLATWTMVESAGDRHQALLSAALVVACGAATIVTPYGWTLWRFLWTTVHVSRPRIEEWMPIWSFGPAQWLVPLAAAGAAAMMLVRGNTSSRVPAAAALVVLAIAGARVARVAPLFVESAAILMAPLIAARWPGRAVVIRTREERVLVWSLTAVVGTAALVTLVVATRCIPIDARTEPDPAAVSALNSASAGRLVTFFDWGEYAIWHFGPRLRVSMDGRRETVYSERRMAEHDAILAGTVVGGATLDAWRPEYVWLPATSRATKRWLQSHGYRIDVDTTDSFVAVRSDLSALARTPPESPRCFPG